MATGRTARLLEGSALSIGSERTDNCPNLGKLPGLPLRVGVEPRSAPEGCLM